MAIQLRITQKKSAIGRHRRLKRTLEALGIRRLHQTVIHNDTPQLQGMIACVEHLLEVEEIPDGK